MKSLEMIQKTFRVFQILTKFAMILSLLWAGLALLGIRTIVLPLVAVILMAVVCAGFALPQGVADTWSNGFSISFCIVLILASLVFRYGADLEETAQ